MLRVWHLFRTCLPSALSALYAREVMWPQMSAFRKCICLQPIFRVICWEDSWLLGQWTVVCRFGTCMSVHVHSVKKQPELERGWVKGEEWSWGRECRISLSWCFVLKYTKHGNNLENHQDIEPRHTTWKCDAIMDVTLKNCCDWSSLEVCSILDTV